MPARSIRAVNWLLTEATMLLPLDEGNIYDARRREEHGSELDYLGYRRFF
jgi:hypothetical protein